MLKKSFFVVAVILLGGLNFYRPVLGVTFGRNLRLGDRGEDVRSLQILLNQDSSTKITDIGPGSPGNETDFFGIKTVQAVTKFQEKYSKDILMPNGLYFGTGLVGNATRKKLEALLVTPNIAKNLTTTLFSTGTLPKINPVLINPNAKNLDDFLAGIRQIQIKTGKSSADADSIIQSLRQIALTTTTDFKAKFFSDAAKFSKQPPSNYVFPSYSLPSFIRWIFPQAFAAVGVPFGGPLTYAFPCSCSATTLITIGPPVGGVFDYVYGTQSFLSFNAPYAAWFLGLEIPGEGETCYVPIGYGCTVIPSSGLITPVVGTSPE
jgi:peptidoglycan hydrolase-like protein with peptidoglycan-binding domain